MGITIPAELQAELALRDKFNELIFGNEEVKQVMFQLQKMGVCVNYNITSTGFTTVSFIEPKKNRQILGEI